jgi:uncharacterized protein (TIGR02145 family)
MNPPKVFITAILIVAISVLSACKKESVTPTLKTSVIQEITYTSAASGGEITDNGGAPVTAHGICWSTSAKPTIADSFTNEGAGSGSFVCKMEELIEGTTYYVRAYATNTAGVGYGNELSFKTTELAVATLTTAVVTGITYTSGTSGGDIIDNGGSEITSRGIAWNTLNNPTTENSHTSDGSGTGLFSSSLTDLIPGTTYYVRAYATNRTGTAYGNQLSFTTTAIVLPSLTTADVTDITSETATSGGNVTNDGGGTVTTRGVCWSTTENPTTANSNTSNDNGTGTFVSNLTGLTGGTTYYVRAYATNAAGTAYGNQVSFTTILIVPPTLTTADLTEITSTSAISGGNISNTGGGAITAKGVCWSTTENPDTGDNSTVESSGTAIFISNITGLSDGTVYYVRSYATNSAGTTYGNQITFITPVTDIEGTVYKTARIGTQVWMAENLKVARLNDNTGIPNIPGNPEWMAMSTPAYSWLSNNSANKDVYGALYNWFAVNTGKLCPDGWHVGTDAEYNTMEMHLGISAADVNLWGFRGTDEGTELKAASTWTAGGNGTNVSGFNALAGGYRQWSDGSFPGVGVITYFWTASDDAANGNPTVGWYRRVDNNETRIYKGATEKEGGKYVRCIKD